MYVVLACLLLLPFVAYRVCRRNPLLTWLVSSVAVAVCGVCWLLWARPEPEGFVVIFLGAALASLVYVVEIAVLRVCIHFVTRE